MLESMRRAERFKACFRKIEFAILRRETQHLGASLAVSPPLFLGPCRDQGDIGLTAGRMPLRATCRKDSIFQMFFRLLFGLQY
jgi:hypothetical protein